MKKMKKFFTILLLFCIVVNSNISTVKAEENNNYLSQEEINNLLNVNPSESLSRNKAASSNIAVVPKDTKVSKYKL